VVRLLETAFDPAGRGVVTTLETGQSGKHTVTSNQSRLKTSTTVLQ